MTEPSQTELATLAARLLTEAEIKSQDFDVAARRALRLWHAAGRAIKGDEEIRNRVESGIIAKADLVASVRRPKAFPVTFNKFLLAVLPSKDNADRLPIFKRYLSHAIRIDKWIGGGYEEFNQVPATTTKEINSALADCREVGISKTQFERLAIGLHRWIPADLAERQSKAGRKASSARKQGSKKKGTPPEKKVG